MWHTFAAFNCKLLFLTLHAKSLFQHIYITKRAVTSEAKCESNCIFHLLYTLLLVLLYFKRHPIRRQTFRINQTEMQEVVSASVCINQITSNTPSGKMLFEHIFVWVFLYFVIHRGGMGVAVASCFLLQLGLSVNLNSICRRLLHSSLEMWKFYESRGMRVLNMNEGRGVCFGNEVVEMRQWSEMDRPVVVFLFKIIRFCNNRN